MKVDNKIAIVTGSAQGIGREIAFRFAQEGALVVVVDMNEEGSLETSEMIVKGYGQRAQVISADITSEEQIADMVKSVMNVHQRIDILVNNAGVPGPIKPIEDITVEEWESTMAVNLRGMFLCCKHVIPVMKSRAQGTIVNIASVTGKRPLSQRTPYATSKMGVIGLTRTLAAEVGKWNIRVNAVCPGAVTGTRQKIIYEGIMKETGKSWDEIVLERKQLSPLTTVVDPSYIAAVVVILCSTDAEMMTGQDINVSAGSVMY